MFTTFFETANVNLDGMTTVEKLERLRILTDLIDKEYNAGIPDEDLYNAYCLEKLLLRRHLRLVMLGR